jgi:hypothetical protein
MNGRRGPPPHDFTALALGKVPSRPSRAFVRAWIPKAHCTSSSLTPTEMGPRGEVSKLRAKLYQKLTNVRNRALVRYDRSACLGLNCTRSEYFLTKLEQRNVERLM